MRTQTARLATSMSRILWLALIVGCGGGTSLEGSIPCSTMTCGTDQVCAFTAAGIDAGTGGPGGGFSCETVPDGCELADCTDGTCAPCIHQLCSPTVASRLTGRELSCVGQ